VTTPTDERVLTGTHFMAGDLAIAEGAMAAGVMFFAGYPITPSTEVAERLSRRLPQVGAHYVQMEDELASMCAILGASWAGVRSMTATSGPGFSLMMENIGLGMITDTPCVVVNVQRGGPSTGLPTLTAQADVMQVKWGSHGDYQPIAYAPSSVQECFDYTIKAFNSADRYRVPTFLMGDEIVGHMSERVVIPDASEIPYVGRKRPANGKETLLFETDESLIPAMPFAGEGHRVHVTGLTHDERGYPATFPEPHDKLVRRLSDKILSHADEIIEVEEWELGDADIAVVSFGSTARTARHAAGMAREDGIRAGLLRLITLWPFAEKHIRELDKRVKAFVVAEMNLGQMITQVERFTSKPVLPAQHAGGKMMSPEPIMDAIREAKHAI
jgi:2-oxoglutarate ferredoxin oxidoreductase subunit alpha